MGTVAEKLKEEYGEPRFPTANYYRMYYHFPYSKKCTICSKLIAGEKQAVVMSGRTRNISGFYTFCMECGKEFAELHDKKIENY